MEYKIEGGTLPVVICTLEGGETMITESGAMSWMTPNMLMETTSGGGIGKMFGRALSGESLFLNRYTADGNGMIAFASSFPGSIRAFEITPEKGIIAQKSSFLAGTTGVDLSVYLQRKLSRGLVGGEGFIMQKLTGEGTVFLEFDGHVVEYELAEGQSLVIDTGYVACMEETCTMEVKTVPGLKNMMFGGEGFFNTVVQGPGHVWIQTMPIYQMARSINPYIVTAG